MENMIGCQLVCMATPPEQTHNLDTKISLDFTSTWYYGLQRVSDVVAFYFLQLPNMSFGAVRPWIVYCGEWYGL